MNDAKKHTDSTVTPKTAWWRFPLSILVFIVGFFLFPMLFGLLLGLTNFITPNFFKSSYMWRFIISDIFGISVAFTAMNAVLKDNGFTFQTVFSVLVAVYSISVAVWNWAHAWSTLEQLLGMFAIGITSIVYAVLNGRKISPKNQALKDK